MARPQRRKTKPVKDKSLLESMNSNVTNLSPVKEDTQDKGFYIKEDKESEITLVDLQSVQIKYEEKIKKLEKKLESSSVPSYTLPRPLKKNEYKLLNAIRSESVAQNKDEPIIGRSLLIKKYKIGPNYLTSSILSLEEKGLIKRNEIPYSSTQTTNSWKLLI